MDTGSYMANMADQQIESGLQMKDELDQWFERMASIAFHGGAQRRSV